MVLLSCIALSAACDGGEPQAEVGLLEPTEVNLVISDPATAPEELALLIDFVSYRISCPSSGLTPYDDSVDLSGNLESNLESNPAVWNMVTDLPLSACTIALWVYFEDEVICSGSEALPIVADDDPSAPNKVNIALECSLSVIPPSGNVEIDGTFNLVNGNYCPQLFWLGAVPTVADPTVMNIQTSYIDLDNACGQNCDPTTCDFTQNPPVCTPAPDPGLSSTLRAPAGNGSFGDENAVNTTYACNPLLPGPTEICVLVTDGDNDCDQTRCITVDCPDLCEGVVCDDGNECTRDSCDPLTGVCANNDAPDGIACDNCNSTCQAGACDAGTPFTATVNSAVMNISGAFQTLNTTVVNPYSGEAIALSGQYFVNNSSYKGVGGADLFLGSVFSDVLFIYDVTGSPPEPRQRICGVETLRADNGFDVMLLADEYIALANMEIFGGNADDVLWANGGDDTVRGLNGLDRIDGGPGDDIIEGGSGNDTISLWPGSGFDSISGGDGDADRVEIDAIQSQIQISPAANPSYEFDISYLGTPMAQITEVELLVMNDGFVDLLTCTAGVCALCGNDDLNGGEECDDGNNVSGDGCAADCTSEY